MTSKPLIVTVDCNRRNLEILAQFFNKAGYNSVGVSSLEEFEQVLTQCADDIKLVLVDISGFDSSIWQLCQRLRTLDIAFLIGLASPICFYRPNESKLWRSEYVSKTAGN